MLIYLDNCCYNRPYDEQYQLRIVLETQAKLYIQQLVVERKLDLAVSYISNFENNENPRKDRRNSINNFFGNASVYIDNENVSDVEILAKEIRTMNIAAKDALHIACAVIAKCDAFITTDDGILKRYKRDDIDICTPITFFNIYGKEII
jgi:predicted nucleic acid-binding protein